MSAPNSVPAAPPASQPQGPSTTPPQQLGRNVSLSDAPPPRRPAKRVREPKLPAALSKVLQIGTFEDNYSTEDFIAALSDKLIAESKAEPGPFNPLPLIDTFSPALDTLLKLREQVAERTKTMEGEVRRANREYGKRLRELDSGFEAVGSSFSTLENKITDVGRTAARIGEQLENLHQARSSAQATSLIMSYYISLVHSTSTTGEDKVDSLLEPMFATRNTREGRTRLAVILRRLMAVAKDMADNASHVLIDAEALDEKEGGGIHSPAHRMVMHRRTEKERAELVRDEVEKYCEKFEKGVLRDFDRSYRKGDPRMMQHCAKVLQDFNGGTSCVQIYVNQHDFFISTDKLLEEAGRDGDAERDIWATIGDPSAPPPTTERGLVALFRQIRETVTQEAQIVKAVFPNPIAVMQVFLQRVFAQVIQQHIESLVQRATSISTLAVLRILHTSHAMCGSLVDDLKVYDAKLGGHGVPGPSKIDATSAGGPLSSMLDQALEEMFVPWLEGTRYLDMENKNLVELYAGLLSRFARYHETVLKAKPNSLLDRVVNSMSTTGPQGAAGSPSSTAHAAAAAISKYANLFTSSVSTSASSLKSPIPLRSPAARLSVQAPSPRPGLSPIESARASSATPVQEQVDPEDGQVTVEMAEAMLRWHAEAVGRVVELSPSADVAKNIASLSNVLAEAIGRSFIETALDSAIARLETWDMKTEPDLSCLTGLHPADLVCNLWQRYTSTALVPLTSSSAAVRREMTSFNSLAVIRMEGKINSVIHKAVDAIVSWLSFLLTKQKKNDYKPKNDELSFARTNTEPCELCCEFLTSVLVAATEGLSGKNVEAFLTEVGVAFHSLLLDHYKKFSVNPTGGLMLTKDLASYQEAMQAYNLKPLNDRFDMLRQLGNIFIVQPDVLRSYMTESHLGRIDARLLKPYLKERSDWNTFSRSLAFDDTDDSTAAPPTAASTLLPLRASRRISAMSGVAGLGYQRLRDALRDFESLTDRDKETASGTGTGSASGSATPGLAPDGARQKPLPPSSFNRSGAGTPTTPSGSVSSRRAYGMGYIH